MIWLPSHDLNRLFTRRALLASLSPLALMMCAAAPPEEGVEVRAAAGYSAYEHQSGGCGTTRYRSRVSEPRGYGEVSYRSASGLSVVAESSVSGELVRSTERVEDPDMMDDPNTPPPRAQEEGRASVTAHLAVRPGYHARYGGAELGPLLLWRGLEGREGLTFAASARAWGGVPEVIYGWAQLASGPGSDGFVPLSFGVGHASPKLRLELGLGNLELNAISASAQYHVADTLWLGAQLQHVIPSEDAAIMRGSGALMLMSFRPDFD